MFSPTRTNPPWRHPALTAVSTITLVIGLVAAYQGVTPLAEGMQLEADRQRFVAAKIADSQAIQTINQAASQNGIRYQEVIKLDVDGCALPTFDSSKMHTILADGTRSETYEVVHPKGLDIIEVANTNDLRIGTYSLSAKKMINFTPPITCTEIN